MERRNDLCSSQCLRSCGGSRDGKGTKMRRVRRFNEQRALEARKCPSFFEASAVNVEGKGRKKAGRNKEE